jgi:hypothetical protein
MTFRMLAGPRWKAYRRETLREPTGSAEWI